MKTTVIYDPKIPAADAKILRRHETSLAENTIRIFCNVQPVRWEEDTSVKHQKYYRLVRVGGKFDGKEIGSWPLAQLDRMTDDEFLDKLQEAAIQFSHTEKRLRQQQPEAQEETPD